MVSSEAADGVTALFEEMFEQQYPDLLRFAARRVGVDAAPDVVADVFLVAWRRRTDPPLESPRLWLFAVAGRVVANHLRGEVRRGRLRRKLYANADEVSLPDPTDGADVRAALTRLRPGEQEILRLTEWERLRVDEAAVVLGCSVGAARVRLHRARRRLAAELAPPGEPVRTTAPTQGKPVHERTSQR